MSHWSAMHAWRNEASQVRLGSRGLSRARSEAAMEVTGFYWKPVCLGLEKLSETHFLPSAQSVD